MPREKPNYEEVPEFNAQVAKLIELNGQVFGHIDPSIIRMAAITNKEPTAVWKIKKINNPVAMFVKDVRYIVVTYRDVWNSFSEDQQALVILDVLKSLEPDEEEPRTIPFDLSDHSDMIRTFGVNYLNNPSIRGLFNKPVKWKTDDDSQFEFGSGKDTDDDDDSDDTSWKESDNE